MSSEIKDPPIKLVKEYGITPTSWYLYKHYLSKGGSAAYEQLVDIIFNKPDLKGKKIFTRIGRLAIPLDEDVYPDLLNKIRILANRGKKTRFEEAELKRCGITFSVIRGVEQPDLSSFSEQYIIERVKLIEERVKRVMGYLNISESHLFSISIEKLKRGVLGYCATYEGIKEKRLAFSTIFLAVDLNETNRYYSLCSKWFDETISHEVIHMLGLDHNWLFKKVLENVMQSLGHRGYECTIATCQNVDLFEGEFNEK